MASCAVSFTNPEPMKRSTSPYQLRNVPTLRLDRAAPVPLTHQLSTQIAAAIRSGAVAHDDLLPSTRLLASMLGVSRNTVVVAYELLMADGLSGVRAVGTPQTPRFDLVALLRDSHFPDRLVGFQDVDGTPMYVRFEDQRGASSR